MENLETQGLARGSQSVGSQLRGAREAAGKSRSDIATQTKIAERHLVALEEDRLGDLAARTYAVGFARTYARAVGLDEQAIAAKVREQLDGAQVERAQPLPSFEPGDPARVPTRRLAWLAALGIAVAIGVLLVFWSSFLSPEAALPDLIAAKTEAPATAKPAPPPRAATPAPATGPVVLTAAGDKVWVKVTDAKGEQVLQKELALGESWTAPAGVSGLSLRTGRADALQITVGGQAIAPLAKEPGLVSGVSLAPADLLARGNATPAPSGAAPGPVTATSPQAAASRPAAAPGRTAQRAAAARPSSARSTAVPTPESLLPPSLSTTSD